MFTPSICYILVGAPGSGKSTLAAQMCDRNPTYQIVSTDQIREELFGDASIQGNWPAIETQVFSKIQQSLAAGRPVIYDATNFKRPQRITLLQKLAVYQNVYWVAWHFQTPLETCLVRNKQRSRQVPDEVIAAMYHSLRNFPPDTAEGFAAVYDIPVTEAVFDFQKITPTAEELTCSITNRKNRAKNITLHRYSQLLDFERLMHLIALMVHYPGVGNLQQTDPDRIKQLLGAEPNFTTALDEVCGLMSKFHTPLYADKEQIAADLAFLDSTGMLAASQSDSDIQVPAPVGEPNILEAHDYSDLDLFERLLKTIRFIAGHPFLRDEQTSLNMLLAGLKANQVFTGQDALLKDIRLALKPYKILQSTPMKRGYFLGTGILAKHEFLEVFKLLQSQAENLEDPAGVSIYQTFKDRMEASNILSQEEMADIYPVRAIGNQEILDIDSPPNYAVYEKLENLEAAIEKGELLELDLSGAPRLPNHPYKRKLFRVWPLQMVFHDSSWYLGYECSGGENHNLFHFQRLDKIFTVRSTGKYRPRSEQKAALRKLEKLYKVSCGIFLGSSTQEQQQFLSIDKEQRKSVEIVLELWCSNRSFKYISEEPRRFPANQMKMSPPPGSSIKLKKSLFCLSPTDDPKFPHRFQVTLPKWSLQDVDLKRWIIGFGGEVKVIEPPELVEEVKKVGREMMSVYQE